MVCTSATQKSVGFTQWELAKPSHRRIPQSLARDYHIALPLASKAGRACVGHNDSLDQVLDLGPQHCSRWAPWAG